MIKNARILLLLSLMLGLLCAPVFGQNATQIELMHAEELVFDANQSGGAQRLIGNVRLRHQGAFLFCDSAYLFESTNSLNAYGRVLIRQGDTLQLTGDTLFYNGNTSEVKLRGNIRMQDNDMELTTQHLDYDRKSNLANYYGGGKIFSRANRNILTSEQGSYDAQSKNISFRDSVRLEHPDYTMTSDTLQYDTQSEIAYFFGPTKIVSDENTITTTKGWYDTKNEVSQFTEHSKIITKEQELEGDTLFYNRATGYGEALGNVILKDTVNHVVLTGQKAVHTDLPEKTVITGAPVFTQIQDGDSLHMHADTLLSQKDSSGRYQEIHAWYHVKFFRDDLQGKCDSLSWSEADSTMHLFRAPILWSEENQLTGDHITLKTWSGKIRRLDLLGSAFITSEHDTSNFNQIKGLNMVGHFKDNSLSRIFIEGNGQSIYFVEEAKKDSLGVKTMNTIGMNDAVCSDILILIEEQEISSITFIQDPTTVLFPTQMIPKDKVLLDGFRWYSEHRPMTKEDIFIWKETVRIPEN